MIDADIANERDARDMMEPDRDERPGHQYLIDAGFVPAGDLVEVGKSGDALAGLIIAPDDNDALSLVKLSADSPDRLRKCDVFRVMDSARQNMTPVMLRGFARWLRDRVGDEARQEVEEVFGELLEEWKQAHRA